jgi:hypothetical protein
MTSLQPDGDWTLDHRTRDIPDDHGHGGGAATTGAGGG